jgi:hypothetical protein
MSADKDVFTIRTVGRPEIPEGNHSCQFVCPRTPNVEIKVVTRSDTYIHLQSSISVYHINKKPPAISGYHS